MSEQVDVSGYTRMRDGQKIKVQPHQRTKPGGRQDDLPRLEPLNKRPTAGVQIVNRDPGAFKKPSGTEGVTIIGKNPHGGVNRVGK